LGVADEIGVLFKKTKKTKWVDQTGKEILLQDLY
jgi:hypothetical protein